MLKFLKNYYYASETLQHFPSSPLVITNVLTWLWTTELTGTFGGTVQALALGKDGPGLKSLVHSRLAEWSGYGPPINRCMRQDTYFTGLHREMKS